MGRRAHHEGTLYQDSQGYWVGQVSLGKVLQPDGSYKRLRKTVRGASKADVKAKLDSLKAQVPAGITELSNQTTGEFLNRWLEGAVKNRNKLRTYHTYKDVVDRHVIPHLGQVPLTKLTTQHVWQWLSTLESAGVRAPSRKSAFVVFRTAINQAIADRLLTVSPIPSKAVPRVERREMSYWTPQQAKAFLDVARKHELYPLFALAIGTGMRQGELLALRWEDLDLGAAGTGVVSLQKNLAEHQGKILGVFDLKTKKSRRRIALHETVVAALLTHRNKLLKEKGLPLPQYVFLTGNGTHYLKSNLTKVYKRLIKEANVPEIRFHDLRHTSTTMALASGSDIKTVSARLGHSQISLTLDTYAHVLDSMDRGAADGIAGLLANAPKT